MDRLDAMRAFVRVVESGSFSAVARELGSSQSAVSKQVAALEKHLGVRLLSRTTRALSLTAEGRSYFERAQAIVADALEAESAVRAGQDTLTGRLRIGGSVGFGRLVLFPLVRSFLQAHPQVQVDLQLADGFVDLVSEGLDLAVRIGELADSGLVAQRVGTTQRAVLAARCYVEALPAGLALPTVPDDLARHECIVYSGLATQNQWVFDGPQGPTSVRVGGRLASNSSELVREAVVAGLGLGFAPTWLFARELAEGQVVRLLPDWEPKPLPIHVVYPASRRHAAKVSAFVDHVRAQLAT